MEVEAKITELILEYEKYENIPEESISSILAYDQLATETFEKLGGRYVLSTNTEKLQNHVIYEMLKEVKTKAACMFCKQRIDRIQALKNRIILNIRKSDLNKSAIGDRVSEAQSRYITPEESRKYMRNIWKNEKDFLVQLISVLSDITMEHPTDALFFEVLPVPPNNVRPVSYIS
nr:uncharacterized protein LOC111506283 [Leptinotarsa decemlineata]